MKRLIISSLSVFCTLFAGALPAQNCYECFDPCNALITVEADYLYWTAKQNNREFARLTQLDTGSESKLVTNDKVKQVREDWKSGYRLGVGYRPCDCLWNLDLVYTHFQTNGSKSVQSDFNTSSNESSGNVLKGSVVLPSLIALDPICGCDDVSGNNNSLDYVIDAKSNSKIKMDLGDLNLVRQSFCSTGCINVNFLFGLRTGRLSSHWNTHYTYPSKGYSNYNPFQGDADSRQHTSINWSYLFVGPRFGAIGDVNLGCGFSIYGNFSGSLVWGKLKRSNTTYLESVNGSSSSDISKLALENIRKGTYKLTPVLQAEAGLAYTYVCDQFSVQARIGVEMLTFINVAENTHYVFLKGPRAKDAVTDLDLYGLTTGFTVAF